MTHDIQDTIIHMAGSRSLRTVGRDVPCRLKSVLEYQGKDTQRKGGGAGAAERVRREERWGVVSVRAHSSRGWSRSKDLYRWSSRMRLSLRRMA